MVSKPEEFLLKNHNLMYYRIGSLGRTKGELTFEPTQFAPVLGRSVPSGSIKPTSTGQAACVKLSGIICY